MMVKSTFHDLLCDFIHRWQCPNCMVFNVVGLRSPLTQCTTRRCNYCKNEYDIQLDMEGIKAHKEKLVKKFGAEILSGLVPGY